MFNFFSDIPTWFYFLILLLSIAFGVWARNWVDDEWQWLGWILAGIFGLATLIRVLQGFAEGWIALWGWIERNSGLAIAVVICAAVTTITGQFFFTIRYKAGLRFNLSLTALQAEAKKEEPKG